MGVLLWTACAPGSRALPSRWPTGGWADTPLPLGVILDTSVVHGIKGSVKVLRNINLTLASLLLLSIIVVGLDPGFFAALLLETIGAYAAYLPALSNLLAATMLMTGSDLDLTRVTPTAI